MLFASSVAAVNRSDAARVCSVLAEVEMVTEMLQSTRACHGHILMLPHVVASLAELDLMLPSNVTKLPQAFGTRTGPVSPVMRFLSNGQTEVQCCGSNSFLDWGWQGQ